MTKVSGTGTVPLSSAQKGLAVLETMADYSTSVGVSELARSLGWARGTMHKWLVTLVTAGWVEQDLEGLYRLSLRPVAVANGALRQASLDLRLMPFLEDLANRCRETISLAVLDGESALIVQRVESPQVLSVNLRLGSRMPLANSASGIVLSAFSPSPVLERLRRDGVELPSEEKLAATRKMSLARSVDDLQVGISAAAVPILSSASAFCAALSVATPTQNGLSTDMIDNLRDVQSQIHTFIKGNV